MIHHVSIGVHDIRAALRFYDSVLRPLGYRCLQDSPESLGYGDAFPAFWLSLSERPVPADERSGLHICFAAPSRESVDAFHSAGIAGGGRDNGRPGLRADYGPGYYAAFLSDPDGYRIEAYFDEQGS
jgi:catechol 2,3-dioxygenase-like lactoylglutathione lyase family enzyme